MTKKATTQPQDKYVLRMPDGMREHIKEAAEASGRSMNAEIVHRLQAYDELTAQLFEATQVALDASERADKMFPQYRATRKMVDQWKELAVIMQPHLSRSMQSALIEKDSIDKEQLREVMKSIEGLVQNVQQTQAILKGLSDEESEGTGDREK